MKLSKLVHHVHGYKTLPQSFLFLPTDFRVKLSFCSMHLNFISKEKKRGRKSRKESLRTMSVACIS